MPTPPRITTVIPTYRRPLLLRRAVESALAQEDAALAVRVFDNASGDGTRQMIESIGSRDPRLEYVCHAENIGAAANFECAVRSITTPFFSILSDDDYLLPDFYRNALKDLDAHPEAMFWAGLTLNVDEQGTIWDARLQRWPREGLILPPEGLLGSTHGRAPTWTGILFRTDIFARVGFPEWQMLGPSDLDFTLKAATQPFVLRKHPSAVFTLNSSSFSATQPLSSFWPGWQKLFRNMEDLPIESVACERLLAALHADARRMLFRRGANAIAAGRHEFACDAAQALHGFYGERARAGLLRGLSAACRHIPGAQRVLATAYRGVERVLVRSRSELQRRHAHLLRAP
jgi:hypothetical protein